MKPYRYHTFYDVDDDDDDNDNNVNVIKFHC